MYHRLTYKILKLLRTESLPDMDKTLIPSTDSEYLKQCEFKKNCVTFYE